MIAIYDNGGSYDNHCINFVEVESRDQAEAAIRALGDSGYTVIALAERIEWYEGAPQSIEDFLQGAETYAVDSQEVVR